MPDITVYILKCSDGLHYTGMTNNIERRLKEHNSGQSFFTSHHLPVYLIHSEIYPDRKRARIQEVKIKKQGASRYLLILRMRKQFGWLGNIT